MLDFSEARKCSPTNCFRTVRQKKWRRIVSYPKKHFSISRSFWSTIGCLYEMFRYCETSAERRNFSGESWYTWPSYARKVSILKILWNTKGFPYEMRQYCEPKTLTRILMPTPFLVLSVFWNRKFSETQKGSLTKSFGTMKQGSFTENPDTPNPLMHEKFLNQIFSETMKASLRNVSLQWDKKSLRTIVMPTQFLFPNIFPKNNFWNTEGLIYEMFRYCEMKPFRRTILTTAPFPILNIFRFQTDLEHRKVPLPKVSVPWNQKSRRRVVMCTHFLFLYIFRHKKFLKPRTVHLRNVWVLWDKNFQRKIVKPFPLLCMKNFDCKTSETQKGSPTKFFGTVSQKSWRGSWCPPPLFTSTFFNIKNFLKHRRVPLRMVRDWKTNIFEAQSWSPDPFFLQHFLHLEIYLKHRRVPWRTLLVLWNKIVLRRIMITLPFLCMKNFDARFFLKRGSVPQRNISELWDKKIDGESFLIQKNTFRFQKVFEAQ